MLNFFLLHLFICEHYFNYSYTCTNTIVQMAYIFYNNLWESEFDNIVSKRDTLQDLKTNQLKLEVHDRNNKDEKLTTKFEPSDDSDT